MHVPGKYNRKNPTNLRPFNNFEHVEHGVYTPLLIKVDTGDEN
jgi:hypothetical protein